MQAFAYFYFLILLVSWDALDLPSLNFFTAASLAAMAASLAFSAVSVTLVATLSAAFFYPLADIHFVGRISHRYDGRLADAVSDGAVSCFLEVAFYREKMQDEEKSKTNQGGLEEPKEQP